MAMHPISTRLPYPDGTPLMHDPTGLHRLAETEGIVCLRQVLDPGVVHTVSAMLRTAANAVGWIHNNQGLPGVHENPNDPAWQTWYRRIQASRALHQVAHEPRLLAAISAIVGGEVLVHPRHIARCVGPDTSRFSTPPHQDTWYIGGTQDIWTAWAPMVDCPINLGGLAVIPRSHRQGERAREAAVGAGGSAVAGELSQAWCHAPVEAGDVLLFHGHTVHQGCDNLSRDLRFSLDMRFQRADLPVRADSLEPHFGIAPWDELYAEWPTDDPLRSYWQRQALNLVA